MILWTILLFLVFVLYGEGNIELKGTYVKELDGEIVYQVPNSSPKGVLFVAHSCSHSILDWWPKSSTCEQCNGLPLEMTIVQEAINNNFAVLALSSVHGTNKKCWVHGDVSRARAIINRFYESTLHLSTASFVPLHMLGVSIGGNFVVALAQSVNLSPPAASACLISSSAHIMNHNDGHLPPLLFILMEKDTLTSVRVQSILAQGHVHSKVYEVREKPITPEFFHIHSRQRISLADSTAIQTAFVKSFLIDGRSFLQYDNPSQSSWRSVSSLLTSFIH
jgi:hypothetical protein